MSKEEDNKAVVVRWFTDFWGENVNLSVVDDIASPDMLLKYSLHEPRRGHDDIKAFMTDFRRAFPDLQFGATAGIQKRSSSRITISEPAQRLARQRLPVHSRSTLKSQPANKPQRLQNGLSKTS